MKKTKKSKSFETLFFVFTGIFYTASSLFSSIFFYAIGRSLWKVFVNQMAWGILFSLIATVIYKTARKHGKRKESFVIKNVLITEMKIGEPLKIWSSRLDIDSETLVFNDMVKIGSCRISTLSNLKSCNKLIDSKTNKRYYECILEDGTRFKIYSEYCAPKYEDHVKDTVNKPVIKCLKLPDEILRRK